MHDKIHLFKNLLKDNSLKVTLPRLAIFKVLLRHNQPIGMTTLINSLSSEVDRSCVYRNIDTLNNIGVISKVYSGWKYRIELSEIFRPHHHHMTCENCGIMLPVGFSGQTENEIVSAGKKKHFKIRAHEIELRGLCKNCY